MHAYNVFQQLLGKINTMEKEKEDITKKFQEQIVSLENEYEVCTREIQLYFWLLLVFCEALHSTLSKNISKYCTLSKNISNKCQRQKSYIH